MELLKGVWRILDIFDTKKEREENLCCTSEKIGGHNMCETEQNKISILEKMSCLIYRIRTFRGILFTAVQINADQCRSSIILYFGQNYQILLCFFIELKIYIINIYNGFKAWNFGDIPNVRG